MGISHEGQFVEDNMDLNNESMNNESIGSVAVRWHLLTQTHRLLCDKEVLAECS